MYNAIKRLLHCCCNALSQPCWVRLFPCDPGEETKRMPCETAPPQQTVVQTMEGCWEVGSTSGPDVDDPDLPEIHFEPDDCESCGNGFEPGDCSCFDEDNIEHAVNPYSAKAVVTAEAWSVMHKCRLHQTPYEFPGCAQTCDSQCFDSGDSWQYSQGVFCKHFDISGIELPLIECDGGTILFGKHITSNAGVVGDEEEPCQDEDGQVPLWVYVERRLSPDTGVVYWHAGVQRQDNYGEGERALECYGVVELTSPFSLHPRNPIEIVDTFDLQPCQVSGTFVLDTGCMDYDSNIDDGRVSSRQYFSSMTFSVSLG